MPPPIRLTYGDDPSQHADLYRPAGQPARGIAVIIHGGFWRSRYDSALGVPLCEDLAARGHLALNLEYRRVGNGGGWPGTFDDIAAGIDLLATVADADLSSVITIGHSAGGQLAVWAAGLATDARVTVTGAISQAGVLSLEHAANTGVGNGAVTDLLGADPDYQRVDPIQRLPIGVPVRALHAQDDVDVPFDQSVRYVQTATAAGDDATLIEVRGGHMALVDVRSAAWAATLDAFNHLI